MCARCNGFFGCHPLDCVVFVVLARDFLDLANGECGEFALTQWRGFTCDCANLASITLKWPRANLGSYSIEIIGGFCSGGSGMTPKADRESNLHNFVNDEGVCQPQKVVRQRQQYDEQRVISFIERTDCVVCESVRLKKKNSPKGERENREWNGKWECAWKCVWTGQKKK